MSSGPDKPWGTTFEASGDAPRYPVNETEVTCIEHPCVIRNVDNAIKSLGGSATLEKFLGEGGARKTIGASLRPDDPLAKPHLSHAVPAKDVVVRITVPKRTGRKRKRGSTEPYAFHDGDAAHSRSFDDQVKDMLRSMRAHPETTEVKCVGKIKETHRFRHLPDFQYASNTDDLMRKIKDSLLTFSYAHVKNFSTSMEISALPADQVVAPPPAFSQMEANFNYGYEQNPELHSFIDPSGRKITINLQAFRGYVTHVVPLNAERVPSSSPNPLPPEDTLHPFLQKAIADLRAALAERPIISRRVSMNMIGRDAAYFQRYAWAYLGYVFKAGPWKDCLIQFGLDPRADPKYRIYQTIGFTFNARDMHPDHPTDTPRRWKDSRSRPAARRKPTSAAPVDDDDSATRTDHLFDGRTVSLAGKRWQLCDITDPLLRRLLDNADTLATPDLHAGGFYRNGTVAVVRAVMRDKIDAILAGRPPDDATYEPFLSWPAQLDDETLAQTQLPDGVTERQVYLAARIRGLALAIGRTPAVIRERGETAVVHQSLVGEGGEERFEEMSDEEGEEEEGPRRGRGESEEDEEEDENDEDEDDDDDEEEEDG